MISYSTNSSMIHENIPSKDLLENRADELFQVAIQVKPLFRFEKRH